MIRLKFGFDLENGKEYGYSEAIFNWMLDYVLLNEGMYKTAIYEYEFKGNDWKEEEKKDSDCIFKLMDIKEMALYCNKCEFYNESDKEHKDNNYFSKYKDRFEATKFIDLETLKKEIDESFKKNEGLREKFRVVEPEEILKKLKDN